MKDLLDTLVCLVGCLLTMSACFFSTMTVYQNGHHGEAYIIGGVIVYFWLRTANYLDTMLTRI